jgi:hypothetical protein
MSFPYLFFLANRLIFQIIVILLLVPVIVKCKDILCGPFNLHLGLVPSPSAGNIVLQGTQNQLYSNL